MTSALQKTTATPGHYLLERGVDKSSFITTMVNEDSSAVYCCIPRHFSHYLPEMMKAFFSVKPHSTREITESDKGDHDETTAKTATVAHGLFTQLPGWEKLTQYPYMSKEKESYPFLSLDFSAVGADDSYEQVIATVDEKIAAMFKNLSLAPPPSIDTCKTGRKVKETMCALRNTYKKDCIVVVRDYDRVLEAGARGGFFDKINDRMCSLFGYMLKNNPFLHKALFLGSCFPAYEGKSQIHYCLNNISFESAHTSGYQPFFGIEREELDKLFDTAPTAEERAEIESWYGGYLFGKGYYLNPYSLSCYAQQVNLQGDRTLRPFMDAGPLRTILWGGGDADEADSKKRAIGVLSLLVPMLDGKTIEFTYNPIANVRYVSNGFIGRERSYNHSDHNWLKGLLFNAGYLTPIDTPQQIGMLKEIKAQIPNEEVRTLLKEELKKAIDLL